MSHHFDTPTAIADGRINLCDFYVFPATHGSTVFILTVNPDAGRSSARTFRPDALYEFVVASDGGTCEDIAFRVRFADPDASGHQQVGVLRATGAQVAVLRQVPHSDKSVVRLFCQFQHPGLTFRQLDGLPTKTVAISFYGQFGV